MLLDTSGLYICLDAADAQHSEASSLLVTAPVRVTHNYVLTELVALCQARKMNRQNVIRFVELLAADPLIRMVWVGRSEHDAALRLLRERPDKAYSLCDAVSFFVMRQYGLTDALTTDHHFEQEGFRRLLRP
jgi:predicted nucleic acid-binding protein